MATDVNKRVLRLRTRLQRYKRLVAIGRRIPAETLDFVADQYRSALVDKDTQRGIAPEMARSAAEQEVARILGAPDKK